MPRKGCACGRRFRPYDQEGAGHAECHPRGAGGGGCGSSSDLRGSTGCSRSLPRLPDLAAATLNLRADLLLTPDLGGCPAATSADECAARVVSGDVSGLGRARGKYSVPAQERVLPPCAPPVPARRLAYPMRLAVCVERRYTLAVAVAAVACVDGESILGRRRSRSRSRAARGYTRARRGAEPLNARSARADDLRSCRRARYGLEPSACRDSTSTSPRPLFRVPSSRP